MEFEDDDSYNDNQFWKDFLAEWEDFELSNIAEEERDQFEASIPIKPETRKPKRL